MTEMTAGLAERAAECERSKFYQGCESATDAENGQMQGKSAHLSVVHLGSNQTRVHLIHGNRIVEEEVPGRPVVSSHILQDNNAATTYSLSPRIPV